MFKKKTLTFQEVKSNEDVRGEIVKSNYDYRVDITKNDPRSKDVIKVRFVTSGEMLDYKWMIEMEIFRFI